MKRMMEKGKGKRRTQTKCRANKRRRFAAQSTREAEETKANHRNNLQHREAARMLPAFGFCFHTRFRHRFRFGFGTNCWAALRRGWRLCGTAGLCPSRAACCATTGAILGAEAGIEVESPMKRMMEYGKGETRNTEEISR